MCPFIARLLWFAIRLQRLSKSHEKRGLGYSTVLASGEELTRRARSRRFRIRCAQVSEQKRAHGERVTNARPQPEQNATRRLTTSSLTIWANVARRDGELQRCATRPSASNS